MTQLDIDLRREGEVECLVVSGPVNARRSRKPIGALR